ncbi:LCM-domain-containing protein [Xylariomycetidae sp. FL0641]|nr:LCM-domain-containing protein [Xylariomycetidae sp. FL0641]
MAVTAGHEAQQASSRSAKQQAQDDLVMATNSSSIVSKRSVERLYYPNEPHFFRFFVKKFQRRAPLINRGYHLRLHVIDLAVRKFLQRPSERTKVVVNLGCGSDVLPWQCMTRYPAACCGVKFVDIDFPDLIEKKRKIVLDTPELNSPLTGLSNGSSENILLQSEQYFQIGCDLRDLASIEKAMSSFLDIRACEFIFVAEVSITYMETDAADSVISWASTLGNAEFCLLEQIIPDGAEHPFAKTMLSHFDKLKTPLKSVFTYRDLSAQQRRFMRLGWSYAEALSLWQVWADDTWVSPHQRRELDKVEPFDEWEEFALFAGHYCVVIAKSVSESVASKTVEDLYQRTPKTSILDAKIHFKPYAGLRGQRRFGAALQLTDPLGQDCLANTLGLGTNNRLKSSDIHVPAIPRRYLPLRGTGPSSRLCHTTTDMGHFGSLLIGGRASPSVALRDCWHFSKESCTWSRVQDLPVALYRHASTRLGRSNQTLLIGGKLDATSVYTGCLLYEPQAGWLACEIAGSQYVPVFGAMLVSFQEPKWETQNGAEAPGILHFEGILAGGILQDGTIAEQVLQWDLCLRPKSKPIIVFEPLRLSTESDTTDGPRGAEKLRLWINRFGASAHLHYGKRFAIMGGVMRDAILWKHPDVVLLEVIGSELRVLSACSLSDLQQAYPFPRPLLVGTSNVLTKAGQIVVMGGGATCFSMGTYWNEGSYTLEYGLLSSDSETRLDHYLSPWKFHETVEIASTDLASRPAQPHIKTDRASLTAIPRVKIRTTADFDQILKAGKPVIMEGVDLGACVQTWTPEYLVDQIGRDKKVVVHEAQSHKMDFNVKNFAYVTKQFDSFMSDVASGATLYLRALSQEQPTDQPALLENDFPRLVNTFSLPEELSFVRDNTFSSVLRISGPVNMWLHYDVMANIYCQVSGSKRLVLFPPSDVSSLSFGPGASSSSIDVFSELETSSLASTHPHEAILNPGDVLYLPPVWPHTAKPLTDSGVAVNIFFRNLQSGYAPGKDVYGNRDLAAYEKSRHDLTKVSNYFNKVPQDMRDFYIRRLADELAQKGLE